MISGGVSDASLLTFADAERSPLSIRAKALVFFDPRSRRLRDEIEQLAVQRQPLLIVGETGTGKELLARHAHDCSEREGLFVPVSCSAISTISANKWPITRVTYWKLDQKPRCSREAISLR